MELFDSSNPYYALITSKPIVAPPHFAQTSKFSQYQSTNIKTPYYEQFSHARCEIQLKGCRNLIITGQYPISNNPFMVRVNLKENDDINNEIQKLKKNIRPLKKLLKPQKLEIFEQVSSNLVSTLIEAYNLDLTVQRGKNIFIFQRNYLQENINILGLFRSSKQADRIIKNMSEQFIPCSLKLTMINNVGKLEGNDLQFTQNDLNNNNYNQILFQLNTMLIKEQITSIKRNNNGEEIQIVFVDILDFENELLYLQYLYITLLVISTLQEGGCTILKTKSIYSPLVNYFLYIFTQCFSRVIIDKDSTNYNLMNDSLYIGCYGNYSSLLQQKGFKQSQGMGYQQDLLSAFDKIKFSYPAYGGLFDYRVMTQDNDFEKELTQFHSQYFRNRKFQLKLMQWCAQQQSNGDSNEAIINQIIRNRNTSIELQKQRKLEKKESSQTRQIPTQNNPNQRRQVYQPILMNPVPQVQTYTNTVSFSPLSPELRRVRKNPQKIQQEDEIKRKEELAKQEAEKVRLLLQDNKKKTEKRKR